MNDKPRLIRVTDESEVNQIIGNIDAPMPVGGNTFDGLLVKADELRAWRASQAEGGI